MIFFFTGIIFHILKSNFKENALIIYDNKLKNLLIFIPGNISKNTFYSFEKLTFGGVFLEDLYYKNIFFNDIFNVFIKYLKKKQKIKKVFFRFLP